jgi:hypothetical protein
MRWWKLAGLAIGGLATLAAVTWAVFWIRPPEPAQLVVLVAGYDNTLAVPPNPYGKASASELADLTKPGGWFANRSRLNGSTTPRKLSRSGLTELPANSKCVVVVLAAHGGRDRDGAFLFPEDATGEPAARVRIATLIEQLGKLPARQQKLLILDATEPPAYPDLGLVHNDFASAVEDLNDAIAKVPNLALFMSTGPDQRSWASPEWGQTAFLYHVLRGLQGAADANGDKRITGGELVDFVRPRVHDWARDHRAALQTPVLLPKGPEGEARVAAMHLAMTEGPPPEEAAPTPFDPPAELETAWAEYRELATAYVLPTAYTPHLWRQYEAWTLRYEQYIIAGDDDGARNARSKATELKRQIEAARRLDIGPQTLALQSAVGGLPWVDVVPPGFKLGIAQLGTTPTAADLSRIWASVRNVPGNDPETTRLLWCRALIEWVSGDPLPRLPAVPALVPLVTEGMPVRPAEVNFLLMLARNLPPVDKKEIIAPLLQRIIHGHMDDDSELYFEGSRPGFAESFSPWFAENTAQGDAARRTAEDLCFASDENNWKKAAALAQTDVSINGFASHHSDELRRALFTWQRVTDRLQSLGEWIVRDTITPANERGMRADVFSIRNSMWRHVSAIARFARQVPYGHVTEAEIQMAQDARELASDFADLEKELADQTTKLLGTRPEFDARPTPRASAVVWWRAAESVLTASPAHGVDAASRRDFVREFRRVSRQLLITGKTRPETLPETTPALARELTFEAAERRGQMVLARLDGPFEIGLLLRFRPGMDGSEIAFRLERFPFQADGRQSLAEAGSRLGELFEALDELVAKHNTPLAYQDYWIRLAPAHADVSDKPIDQLRRERVRDFLVAQARRTYLDHWYGEAGTRYYHTAIEYLKADARKLGVGAPGQDPFTDYLVPEPGFPVSPAAPPRFAVTDEPNPELKVTFNRQAPRGIDGFPVFWSSPAFPPTKPVPEVRVPVPTDQQAPLPAFTRPIARPTSAPPTFPVAESSTVHITGFFRGRTTALDVAVDVYRLPDFASVTAPGLKSTAIAVQSNERIRGIYGVGTGAVAIVLDCSGSMGPPDPKDPKDPKDPGPYPKAVKALDELLRALPPGTIVTVSVFGQRMPGADTPEQTIHEVLKPTRLDFDNSEILKQIHRDVDHFEPWNPSPVVRAAIKAKDNIKHEDVPFKAVVLITDGVDNRFADDPLNTHHRSIRDALRAEFPDDGVSLSIVMLPVFTKAEEAVQIQFAEVRKLRPAGLIVTTDNVKVLADWLRSGLNPRVQFTLDSLTGRGGADLTADNWYGGRLEPGIYQFRVNGATKFAKTVKLEAGDRLLVDLAEDNGQLTAKRAWYADSAPGIKAAKTADPWQFSLMQNRSEAGGLRLFTAIEERPQLTEVLEVSRIGDVWFDVQPVMPGAGRVAARWRSAPGYPSATWSVNIPGWPLFPGSKAAASPVVEAWWNPERPFPAAGSWTLPAGESLISTQSRIVKFSGTAVSLDSVSIEQQLVEVTPGGKTEVRRCLVVRLSNAAGNPAWVRPVVAPRTDAPAGSEVRVYRAANRVTCIFWGVDPAKVTGFEVVSLNESLKQAKELRHYGKLDAVPGPTNNSLPPEPPADPH